MKDRNAGDFIGYFFGGFFSIGIWWLWKAYVWSQQNYDANLRQVQLLENIDARLHDISQKM